MIDGAMALLARRGLQATSFAEVLAATGAPRGSLYHHFPGGKDELLGAAVDRASEILGAALGTVDGQPAPAVVERFLEIWRTLLVRSQCEAGCAVLAVMVAAESPPLRARAAAVFRAWRARLAAMLTRGGLDADAAAAFAMVLIAAVEGAVVLSRAEGTMAPFEAVAQQMRAQAATWAALRPARHASGAARAARSSRPRRRHA